MKIIKKNKRAEFDYFLEKKYLAGLVLTGPEVKEIKAGHIDLTESYVRLRDGQLYLWNASVSTAKYPTIDPVREKKLLVHKRELKEISKYLEQKGFTMIAVVVGLDHGLVKIEIAIAKGRKQYDKRDRVKQRESERFIRRTILSKTR